MATSSSRYPEALREAERQLSADLTYLKANLQKGSLRPPRGQGYGYPGYTPVELYRVARFTGQVTSSYTSYLGQIAAVDAGKAGANAAALMLSYLEDGFAKNVTGSITKMMQNAAGYAQEIVLKSYDQTVTNAPERAPSYLRPGRFAGGALRKALADPSFWTASRDGVTFGNVALLNTQGKQWARLNYGAGSKAGSGATAGFHDSLTGYDPAHTSQRGLTFSSAGGAEGNRIGSFYSFQAQSRFEGFAQHILNPGPRPAFTIPRGIWLGGKSGNYPVPPRFTGGPTTDRFFLIREVSGTLGSAGPRLSAAGKYEAGDNKNIFQRPGLTVGIAPRRFLDAGVQTLFSEVSNGTQQLVANWLNLAEKRGIGPEALRQEAQSNDPITIEVTSKTRAS